MCAQVNRDAELLQKQRLKIQALYKMVQRSRELSESDGKAQPKTSTPAASPVAPLPTYHNRASSASTPTDSSVLPEHTTMAKAGRQSPVSSRA